MKKYINIFFSKKYFFPPPNKKFLILDNIFLKIFEKKLKKKHCFFLDIRFKELNLFILFKLFLSTRKVNFFNYVLENIKYIGPKIIITGNDNLNWFYELKRYFPDKKFVSIQNGFRNNQFFKKLGNKKRQSDLIFTFNKIIGKSYSKKIKTKIVPIGSFKNNEIKKKIIKKRNSILFISSGIPENEIKKFSFYKKIEINQSEYFNNDKILYVNLVRYCKENNLSLELMLKDKGSNKEIKFYKSLSKDIAIFFHGLKNYENEIYTKADEVLATVSSTSTFGFENLSRGNRGAIFNNKIKITKGMMNLFFDLDMNAKGVFWSDNVNYSEISRVLNFVTKSTNSTWQKKTKKIKQIMNYDFNNKLFKKNLKI